MATALGALLLTATACSGDDTPDATNADAPATSQQATENEPPVGDSAEEPSEKPGEEPSEKPGEEPDGADDRTDPAAFGAALFEAQLDAGSVHMEATLDGGGGQTFDMVGDMRLSTRNPALDMTMSGAGFGEGGRFIVVDKRFYLKFPGLAPRNKFVVIDPRDSSDPMAQSFGQMLRAIDPSRSLAALKAITSLERVGEETVDGVETTEYAVTVDTRKALRAQGVPVPPGQLPDEIDYRLWVDDDDLVRRFSFDLQGVSMQMTFSDWGEPVNITAPPRRLVTELPQGRS
ncbi:MAG: LppX_LprAFG lipoprotein [Actinomycetota bacterium]|nr:LppX_LprAFG lipoprotein [Actinomycetota bacterium]